MHFPPPSVAGRDRDHHGPTAHTHRQSVGVPQGFTILLNALNTGHDGGAGTLHANAAVDVPARIEALACAAGLSREAVHSQLAATRSLIIHLARGPQGTRRVAEVCVLRRDTTGTVHALPAVAFSADGRITEHPALPDLRARIGDAWRSPPPHAPSSLLGPDV
ncbi:ATPase, T2SS/T4P/T4SS family [Streptomonospora sp. PA3]|uniref:ATPase, T2SS/T4P/T4SS family n=1 Tax=Streptomonospora sp. PA3 TaxID=2607326 RepID=UPI0037435573